MRFLKTWLLAAASLALAILPLHVQDAKPDAPPKQKINWIPGPTTANLQAIAELKEPADFRFTGPKGTRALLEAQGNPTSDRELGLLAHTSIVWVVVFEFDKTGYVKDDDKDKLDADAMMKSIREGNEYGN